MLSNTIINQYGIRVMAMVCTGLTTYGWDKKKRELTPPPHRWLYWNWNISNSMGYCLCGFYVVYIYVNVSSNQNIGNDSVSTSFFTLVFTWGELILIMVINILASRIRTMQNEIMFTTNQLFKYHNEVSKWLEERDIVLDQAHKKRILTGELIVIIIGYATFVFPCIIFSIVFHPLEPIHNMVNDWLEFELTLENLSWSLLVLVPPLFLSILAAGNTILVICVLSMCSHLVVTTAVEDMTPMQITQRHGCGRYTFQTQYYGELKDEEIMIRHRVQQVFNVLTNEIFASFAISLHHVACLAVVCICAFATIKFPNVLADAGIVGYVIVFGMIIFGLWIEYLEATFIGRLSDTAETFRKQGHAMTGRRSLFRVFARSCRTLHLHVAYPFYTIDGTTFLEFVDAVLDKTITLLLW